MRFSLSIPDLLSMRVGKESYVTLPSGTVLHRIHLSAFRADQFNRTSKGSARFSPVRNAAETIIPTIYGAQSFECAVCEIILRCPDMPPAALTTGPLPLQIVSPSDFAAHSHSELQTTVDLTLVDLTVAGQRKVGVNGNALLAGPRSTYGATRGWAERLHAKCPHAQGLYYSSVQYGPDFAILLFGDRIAAGAVTPMSTRPIADPKCHDEIRILARRLSIDYEDI